jgi:hypothetical protein
MHVPGIATVSSNSPAAAAFCSPDRKACDVSQAATVETRSCLSCAVGGCVPESDNCIRLGTFLALNDVEFDVVALFQCFVAVQLYCRVMDEHIRTVFPPDESVALGVVKPLHFAFVLSHRLAFLTVC